MVRRTQSGDGGLDGMGGTRTGRGPARDSWLEPVEAAAAELDALAGGGRLPQGEVLGILKGGVRATRSVVRADFEAGQPADRSMRTLSSAMDRLIGALFDLAAGTVFPAANPTTGDRFALVAQGGYGRGALAPFSDIDLLFLLPYKVTPRVEQILEYTLMLLWDTGLKVGHATRSTVECLRLAREDTAICTSLLETRFLWGEESLYRYFRESFTAEVVERTGPEFVERKLAERDRRHLRFGDSRYVVEPNVKEGKGGLRDLQTLYWVAKYLYRVEDVRELVPHGVFTRAELGTFDRAERFLSAVRCHLHYLNGRGDDRLTFDLQPLVAERLGYNQRVGARAVERFMKHYHLVAKNVGALTRIFCAAIEEEHRRRPLFSFSRLLARERGIGPFRAQGGWIRLRDDNAFEADPLDILRLFHAAQSQGLDIHPMALRRVTQSLRRIDRHFHRRPEAAALFLRMLTSSREPDTTLRRLNEAGVLGRLIPIFGRVVAQMQYDMYHTYTVDEHTIRAVGILHRIERGDLKEELPVASEVVHKVISRRVLYLAVFLHDIAKGRGGDHSVLGARDALKLCPGLGLTEEETETVAWLVRHHLAMTGAAFKFDLNDPSMVADFAELVQSPERLRLLLVLTVADIRAVGPNAWNAWKAALLRELYFKAEELLSGGAGEPFAARAATARAGLRAALPHWSDRDFAALAEAAPPAYWLACDRDALVRNAELVARVRSTPDEAVIEMRADAARAVTEVTFCAPDHPGLFSRIAGALAASGVNVVEARIFTFSNGVAVDTLWIQDAEKGAVTDPRRLEGIGRRMRQALSGELDLRAETRRRPEWAGRGRAFTVPPRVLIDNQASATHTVIEVNGRDRPGFLFDVSRALGGLSLRITTARIATYGERVVDVFYVKDLFGLKVVHDGKLDQVRETLLKAVAGPDAAS